MKGLTADAVCKTTEIGLCGAECVSGDDDTQQRNDSNSVLQRHCKEIEREEIERDEKRERLEERG